MTLTANVMMNPTQAQLLLHNTLPTLPPVAHDAHDMHTVYKELGGFARIALEAQRKGERQLFNKCMELCDTFLREGDAPLREAVTTVVLHRIRPCAEDNAPNTVADHYKALCFNPWP